MKTVEKQSTAARMRDDGEPVYRIARQMGVRPRTMCFWAIVWRGIRMETPYEVIAH